MCKMYPLSILGRKWLFCHSEKISILRVVAKSFVIQ